MKNVVKKLFSLLLVGVVTVSMFSFVAPTNAEAAEADSYGTLIINQRGVCKTGFHVTFYDYLKKNLGEYDTGCLNVGNTRKFKIPKNTYRVHVYVSIVTIFKDKKEKNIDFYADESAVNEKSRIELTSTNVTVNPKFDVKFNNGWSETAEQPRKGYIWVTNVWGLSSLDPIFKATFYRGNRQIGKKVISIKSHIDEQFEVPEYTTRVEFEVWKVWGDRSALVDSATFKLSNKVAVDDVTKVKCNDLIDTNMDISCPESWERI